MRCIAWAFTLVLIGACAGPVEDDERAPSTSAASSAKASSPVAKTPAATPPVAKAMPRQPPVHGFAIEKIDAKRAEDGTGALVEATDPRALVVSADHWPGRALDPVLHIGQLHFHKYEFPSKGALRYVVADAALLTPGVEVAIQYGNDTSSRVVITPSLEVTR
jgi:hypothetical protein